MKSTWEGIEEDGEFCDASKNTQSRKRDGEKNEKETKEKAAANHIRSWRVINKIILLSKNK